MIFQAGSKWRGLSDAARKTATAVADVEQRWFVGAHTDMGGGYPDARLSDGLYLGVSE